MVVRDIRIRAAAHGRNPADILVFLGRTVVVGRTRREAEEKFQEYHRHASIEGALAHFSSSSGIDLSRYELDEPIRYEKNNANNSAVEAITTHSREPWTLRRIIGQMGLGSRNAPIVGSAEEVADELIAWVEETGVDGFNLSRVVTPETFEDFVDLVVPILQERGVYKTAYREGTLRQKLFGGASGRLQGSHVGASYRYQRARDDAPGLASVPAAASQPAA
jgi:alkanesulfonate monooxygenase SsuD/methylene tetrahydromethanopterin reductase-like flavin-dependent oxidoreductase (luciferase family)